jgi:DNA repair exonuclease SbcCD ATPase subunit
MDRRKFLTVHEKAKLSLSALNDFVTKEYVKTKTLEETFQLIDELHSLEKQLVDAEAEIKAIENERVPVEKELAGLEKKTVELKSDGPVDQLFLVEAEIEKLNKELKQHLRHLQKPFKKMRALALYRGGAGLTTDEREKLAQYLQKPFKAFSTEQEGYPVLKQILQKTQRLIDEGKLKLKSDKKRKAEQDIDAILNSGSLAKIYSRCADVAAKETAILNSEKMAETRSSLSTFQEQKKRLTAKKARIEAHEAVKKRAYNDIVNKISSHKKAIEKNIHASLDKKIHIT